MGKVITVGNLKGGTGKSTIAINVACSLAGKKTRVILIDADAQGTATDWAAAGELPIEVIPLPLDDETDNATWISEVIAIKTQNDLVVVDLPPHIGATLQAALVVSDLFLVPVTPSGADLKATMKALDLLGEARNIRGNGKPPALLIPSRVDRRTGPGREIEAVLHDFGEPVAPAICQRSAHVDAFTAGQWIGAFARKSAAHTEIDALCALIKRKVK